ncbi:hypothetical protein [Calothrix sp. PCC 7507]|uniref:hypothetical protein n=1 Tax=Calothrix sp. PCC 7507 TaxID=99598 RepID=UPI00029EDD25|nr:hypothetical protein [Calothrix sp. PCC 7507]AFY35701.1 hypothetical protein Cal7507_5366 [Calothrix sp. PCC 7507]
MGIKTKTLGGLFVLLTASIAFPSVVAAQTEAPNYETANDAFDRAFFRHDRNFYENTSYNRQLNSIFGSFPENEIADDAELVNTLYRDVLTQQVGNDPYIRTPDLPNPYGTSLLMSPRLNANQLKVGTEFRFDGTSPR